ncbi:MAG: hypothetical protein F6K18_12730 [Okeania sp. SIO2C2]|uniref:hypothetical protein n=1 Tax=Okeania sp. SIO2C2 TaxID=2607787 RepID=UPI0013B63059|nr:hypothetical protein [Okeania sp. SIO2C2]NEP87611.1 hypothetical protein [Okeania sp. SIO2C2]
MTIIFRSRNFQLFGLPTDSPQPNLTEIIWKFIKYQWIEFDVPQSRQNLLNYLKKLLDDFGTKYVINFV